MRYPYEGRPFATGGHPGSDPADGKALATGRHAFDAEELIRVWVVHHLEIIGEACRGLSREFRRAHSDEIWADAVSFRNVLVHQYFGLDYAAIWAVVTKDLPVLKQKVEDLLSGPA